MHSELPAPTGETPAGEAAAAHHVSIEERGSFAFAHCVCGWFAPGRRSRDRARRDAADHLDDLHG